MFDLFASKNKRLVNKWQREHEEIVTLAGKVITTYAQEEYTQAKKYLKELNSLTVDHVMNEDIEFFKMMHEDGEIDKETEEMIKDFVQGFKKTKLSLINFLGHYAKIDIPLDEHFFREFNELVEAIKERIHFEETRVYSKLKLK